MRIAVFYVGSSLLASLRRAEREIEKQHRLKLRIAAHSCTLPLTGGQWTAAERDLAEADIVFVIHVTDAENAARIAAGLDRHRGRHRAVIVLNCLGELMRRIKLGETDLSGVWKGRNGEQPHPAAATLRKSLSWMAQTWSRRQPGRSSEQYLKFVVRLPGLLRFVPAAGKLAPVKHYLTLFCYFLQPTAGNIRSMLLYAVKQYLPGQDGIRVGPPEKAPATGIYHPDAASLFATFDAYRAWYGKKGSGRPRLDADSTAGLLLLRPQVVSTARRHYDAAIRALEAEGLAVLPVLSTFMDNREACREFVVDRDSGLPRVSQLLSLTGFSFVGGPAMNDAQAAVGFLKGLNRPFRSAVSLESQTIEHWAASAAGLNAVQTAMQVAIPEIDGASEPFVFGGVRSGGDEPEPVEDRCRKIARRMSRWNRLRALPPSEARLAVVLFCFPPDKGNLGTAAGLDVIPSLWSVLARLKSEGYRVELPGSADALRELLLGGQEGLPVAHRMSSEEYYRLCPYVEEIEAEWGPVPGRINSQGNEILIHGAHFGSVFVGIQPTFGYEGDPMRMLTAKGPTPHHGFAAFYTYIEKILQAGAVVHFGTHGALEFMPGKQVGLSSACWPDRLIGDLPNVYIYSVNNPSEGTIARRRSYAELISYLTPPVESAGLYKELASLKELIGAYRQCRDEEQKAGLFSEIRRSAQSLRLDIPE